MFSLPIIHIRSNKFISIILLVATHIFHVLALSYFCFRFIFLAFQRRIIPTWWMQLWWIRSHIQRFSSPPSITSQLLMNSHLKNFLQSIEILGHPSWDGLGLDPSQPSHQDQFFHTNPPRTSLFWRLVTCPPIWSHYFLIWHGIIFSQYQCRTMLQVTHKCKCVVRVVAACPWRAKHFLSSSRGQYRLRLTLEDPTARIHAYLCEEDGVSEFICQ